MVSLRQQRTKHAALHRNSNGMPRSGLMLTGILVGSGAYLVGVAVSNAAIHTQA